MDLDLTAHLVYYLKFLNGNQADFFERMTPAKLFDMLDVIFPHEKQLSELTGFFGGN